MFECYSDEDEPEVNASVDGKDVVADEIAAFKVEKNAEGM